MPEFKFTATSAEGKIRSDTMVADNEEDVELYLKKENMVLVNLRLIPEAKESLTDQLFKRVNSNDKAQFLEYFASMLEAGLSINDVLQAFYEDLDKPRLRKFVKETQYGVRNGKTLSECFANYSDLFPQLYVGMIKVGEASGTLAQSLRYLANQLKKSNELTSRVRNAMIYPIILITALTAVIAVLLIFVFPKLIDFFKDAKLELPLMTRLLISLSTFMRDNLLLIILALIGLFFVYQRVRKLDVYKRIQGKVLLRIPILGRLNRTMNIAVFTRTFGSLLLSGVNILESVDVVKASMANKVYQDILDHIKEDLSKGNTLADSMKNFPQYFSPFEIRVLSISERTGEVAKGLENIAEFYETKLYGLLSGLSSAIEPLLLITMGGLVVVVALSVITPIYQLLSGIQGGT